MLEFEKIKRDIFCFALDGDPVDLFNIYYYIKDNLKDATPSTEIQTILNYIKLLLDEDLFVVMEDYSDTEKIPLSNADIILKIQDILEKIDEEGISLKLFFNFTAKGKLVAESYYNKKNEIRSEAMLLCESGYSEVLHLMTLVEKVFKTFDDEEKKYEFIDCFSSLTDWYFIEAGFLKNGIFKGSGRIDSYELEKLFDSNELKFKYINEKKIFFHITPKGKAMLEEWKSKGGKLSEYFNKFRSSGTGRPEKWGSLRED